MQALPQGAGRGQGRGRGSGRGAGRGMGRRQCARPTTRTDDQGGGTRLAPRGHSNTGKGKYRRSRLASVNWKVRNIFVPKDLKHGIALFHSEDT